MSTNWRFLIIEDKVDQVTALKEALPTCIKEPDTVSFDVVAKFKDALDLTIQEFLRYSNS